MAGDVSQLKAHQPYSTTSIKYEHKVKYFSTTWMGEINVVAVIIIVGL